MDSHSTRMSDDFPRRWIARRRFLAMSTGMAATAILAACGGGGTQGTNAPAPTSTGGAQAIISRPTAASASAAVAASPSIAVTRAELKGKITIARQPASPLSNGKEDPGDIAFQQLLDRYQKEHPGVALEWVKVPGSSFDELTQWIQTRQSARTVPTISGHYVSTTTTQDATNTSPWVKMTPYLEKNSAYTGKPWKEDFPADALAYVQASLTQLYSITLTAYKAAWLYNKNLWTKAGLTEADEPKTWVDFFKVLDKLKASGVIPMARTGDAFALSHTYWVTLNSVGRKTWLEMSGGKLFADDQTRFKALCAGTWKMDTSWNRKAAETTKRLFQYWPTGSTSLKAADVEQLFLTQKAVLWQGTPGNQGETILRRLDEAKSERLETFDVGAFPTPQPDADTFGADIAKDAAPIADDGETGLEYHIAIPEIRQDKDAAAEAIAVDWEQWMTTPEIQAFYVKPSYELPINPNVKLDDPRLLLFYKNKTQGFPTHWFYGNRPDWLPNFQGYLLGQKNLDQYIVDEQKEITTWTQQQIRQGNLNIPCG